MRSSPSVRMACALTRLQIPGDLSSVDRQVLRFGAKLTAVFEHCGPNAMNAPSGVDMDTVLRMIHALMGGEEASGESEGDNENRDDWFDVQDKGGKM